MARGVAYEGVFLAVVAMHGNGSTDTRGNVSAHPKVTFNK